MQQSNISPQQYGDNMVDNSRTAADFYDEGIMNDCSMQVRASIRHSLHHYCAQNHQSDLTDIAFPVE